jgi:hypothetical protein
MAVPALSFEKEKIKGIAKIDGVLKHVDCTVVLIRCKYAGTFLQMQGRLKKTFYFRR